MINLVSISEYDLPLIQRIQKEAFKALYEKYQDRGTSPYTQSMATIKEKFYTKENYYFFLVKENETIGFVRVVVDNEKQIGKIAPIVIRPVFENNGYGSDCLLAIESYFCEIKIWKLSTIYQEAKLIHFYEKNGYRQLNIVENINEKMDLAYFIKIL